MFVFLVTVSTAMACCGRDRESEILFAADGPPLTITYVSPDFSSVAATEQVAIERFLERAPGIEIDRQPLRRDAADYLLDTPPPDVMLLWDGVLLRSAAEQGLLSDLADLWTESNFAESYGDRFHDLSRIEGTPRLVPAGFSWTGIYYNVELFERYGLAPRLTGKRSSTSAIHCWQTARRLSRLPGRTRSSAVSGSTTSICA